MEYNNLYELIVYLLNLAGIYEPLSSALEQFGAGYLLNLTIYTVEALMLFGFAAVCVLALTYMERKVLADVQIRLGPMVAGPHGILQPITDAVKLLFKEDIQPKKRDKVLYFFAPVVIFASTYLLLTVIPLDEGIVFANVGIGLLLFIAVSSITPLGVLIAGYASGNKYSLLSSVRSAAQMMSYVVTHPGTNVKVCGIDAITGNTLYMGPAEYTIVGVDLMSDEERLDMFYSRDFDEVRVRCNFKLGAQIAFPEYFVTNNL